MPVRHTHDLAVTDCDAEGVPEVSLQRLECHAEISNAVDRPLLHTVTGCTDLLADGESGAPLAAVPAQPRFDVLFLHGLPPERREEDVFGVSHDLLEIRQRLPAVGTGVNAAVMLLRDCIIRWSGTSVGIG